ncbi:MAG: phage tail protein [Ornithinimicrobium sp.]
MRGALPGLASPHPLGETLPALFQDDAFAQAMCQGLDETLSPVFAVLDNLAAYLDLATTPEDMLVWMSQWLGLQISQDLPIERQRELLRVATEMHGWQGTTRGMRLALEAVFGIAVEVRDSGGSTWSSNPQAALPGEADASVEVVIDPGAVTEEQLETINAFVDTLKPAHVRHRLTTA